MNFKTNVIVIFNPTIEEILEAWKEACQKAISMNYVGTVTSGLEGSHMPSSKHFLGKALDFRSRDIPFELRVNVMHTAQEILGSKYLVLSEPTHFHIEVD